MIAPEALGKLAVSNIKGDIMISMMSLRTRSPRRYHATDIDRGACGVAQFEHSVNVTFFEVVLAAGLPCSSDSEEPHGQRKDLCVSISFIALPISSTINIISTRYLNI